MKLKTLTAAVLVGSMTLALTACGGSGSSAGGSSASGTSGNEAKTFIIASSASSSLTNYKLQQACAEELKEATGGQITLDLNWDGILGDDAVLTENCIAGSIPMISLQSSALVNYIPEVGVFDCPAVFDSEEQAYEGVTSMKETMTPLFEEKGLEIIGMGFQSFRALSTNTKLETVEDFQGMSIRTLENSYHMSFWENMGCLPTPLAFSDLYLALQQGLVDGQDNSATAVYSNKFYEVQDYYLAVPVFMNVSMILMNKDIYDSLDTASQEALQEFGSNYVQDVYDASDADIQNALDTMADDLTVLPVTDEMLAAFKEAGAPVWDTIASEIGDDIVDSYLSTAGISRN